MVQSLPQLILNMELLAMKHFKFKANLVRLFVTLALLNLPAGLYGWPVPQSAPNIGVNGYAATDKAQRGRLVQVAVVIDIPKGYHVNSNRPLESFLVATQLKVEAPGGVRVGPIVYPRALLRTFSFSKDKLSVYEGRAVLRFNVTVPANFGSGSVELKAKLRYQSCSDALCFPPQSREVKVEIPVVGANESVKRINGEYFGRGR